MIDKCPECNEKIEILPIQKSNPDSNTTGTLNFSQNISNAVIFPTYPSTSRTYKCSNPKCWVTKISESWE